VTAQTVIFWILAIGMGAAALRVVTTRNIVHAALYLVVVLAGAAAQYILLTAEFVAWVQVLIYIGAVIVLFLFGIMLTRAPMRSDQSQDNSQWFAGLVVSVFLLGILGVLIVKAFPAKAKINLDAAFLAKVGQPELIGDAFLRNYLVPFEVLGLLLTAALIGAVAIARRD